MSADEDNAITPDIFNEHLSNILCRLYSDIEEETYSDLLCDFYLKLHAENQRLKDFMSTECPKGSTVRANKTYEDFQFELAAKDAEIKLLQAIVDKKHKALYDMVMRFYYDNGSLPELIAAREALKDTNNDDTNINR